VNWDICLFPDSIPGVSLDILRSSAKDTEQGQSVLSSLCAHIGPDLSSQPDPWMQLVSAQLLHAVELPQLEGRANCIGGSSDCLCIVRGVLFRGLSLC
jgi:hypothetical protein